MNDKQSTNTPTPGHFDSQKTPQGPTQALDSLSSSQLQPHNNIDLEEGQDHVPSVHIDEILAALTEIKVPKKHWDAAKEKPKGADMQRLAYNVIKHLREQDLADPRWVKHGRTHGCRRYDYTKRTGATCRCPLWMAVFEHTQDVLENQPRPEDDDDDDEGEESEQEQQQHASQTESDGAGLEDAEQIDSSAAKKLKRPGQRNAQHVNQNDFNFVVPSRRVQKQHDKLQKKLDQQGKRTNN